MLWLALHFPWLPLDVFARGTPAPEPLAVTSSAGTDAEVVACNRAARRRGVRAGMPLAAAWALAANLRIATRDVAAERAALERIAAWAAQFTSTINITAPAEVLLEIAGSLQLFGGLNSLWTRIEQGISALGYEGAIACAPTPLAAQLFARAGLAARIHHLDALRLGLDPLPLEVLGWPSRSVATLHDAGIHTFGACLALPRNGLARRLGQHVLDDLDRALGRLTDARPAFIPAAIFTSSLALPAPVQEAEPLTFAARRLLIELCGWLAATGQGAQRLRLALEHEDHTDTHITLELAAASRDPEHLVTVLRERLARVSLASPAVAITLAAELVTALAARNLTFLPDEQSRAETVARLIERLRARLGDESVRGLNTVADYRPELAWRVCEPDAQRDAGAPGPASNRPLWLLVSPEPLAEAAAAPCYDGLLTLVAGPERIESGWWDGNDVARDYFIARNPAEALFWIYRERRAGGGWFLHGFFA